MLNCLVSINSTFFAQNPGDKEAIRAEDFFWQVLLFIPFQVKLTAFGKLRLKMTDVTSLTFRLLTTS